MTFLFCTVDRTAWKICCVLDLSLGYISSVLYVTSKTGLTFCSMCLSFYVLMRCKSVFHRIGFVSSYMEGFWPIPCPWCKQRDCLMYFTLVWSKLLKQKQDIQGKILTVWKTILYNCKNMRDTKISQKQILNFVHHLSLQWSLLAKPTIFSMITYFSHFRSALMKYGEWNISAPGTKTRPWPVMKFQGRL